MSTPKYYEARYIRDARITIDGVLDEQAWRYANIETSFSFPWESRRAPHTEFRAFFDDEALFFSFNVEDDDIVLAQPFRGKEDVVYEDRVELFLALDEQLARYFCFEIDPLGRVLDYQASHYRQFDFCWQCPGLSTAGRQTRAGYAVEGSLAWKTLTELGFPAPDSGRVLKLGIYRAEFQHTNNRQWRESWMSWVDPRTEEPDFHVPESFGFLKLIR